jgi:hypothetical protein
VEQEQRENEVEVERQLLPRLSVRVQREEVKQQQESDDGCNHRLRVLDGLEEVAKMTESRFEREEGKFA